MNSSTALPSDVTALTVSQVTGQIKNVLEGEFSAVWVVGEVSKVTVKLGDQVMTLAVKNGKPTAEICREVRGVVLSRQPVPPQQWAAALASALMSHAESSAQAAEALRRLVIGS